MEFFLKPGKGMVDFRVVTGILGVLLLVLGGFMLIPLLWSAYHGQEEVSGFLYSMLCCMLPGTGFLLLKPKQNKIGKREGYLIVTLGWLTMCFAAMLPYIFTQTASGFTNAFFESTSGLTTTGATIFKDIEALPESILLWRSLTQWIGGMGIIVLTVAILPLLGVSGIELFIAEVPGPTSEKIHPRIKETAKRLWLIYVGLTVLLCLVLVFLSGMSFFDALNHAFTTMSTGGFSTKNASIAHFNQPIQQYPIIFFMFLAGMNYIIIYLFLKGRFKRAWASDEFKTYLFAILALILICGGWLYAHTDTPLEGSFRDAAFQVISIVTTTGYTTADYTVWSNGMTMVFFFLLFTGACAGSTSGGIKVIRHLVFFKNTLLEFKRLLHPRAIIRIKIDKKIVASKTITHILVFLLIYLVLFLIGSVIMSIILSDEHQPILTAIGSVATSLGNIGPGIGAVGPAHNFADIPAMGKNVLSFFMLIGRLELFTVLIIFTPYFWKTN